MVSLTLPGLNAELDGVIHHTTSLLLQPQQTSSRVGTPGHRPKHLAQFSRKGIKRDTGRCLPLPLCRSPQPSSPRQLVYNERYFGLFCGEGVGLESKQNGTVNNKRTSPLWFSPIALRCSYPWLQKWFGGCRQRRERRDWLHWCGCWLRWLAERGPRSVAAPDLSSCQGVDPWWPSPSRSPSCGPRTEPACPELVVPGSEGTQLRSLCVLVRLFYHEWNLDPNATHQEDAVQCLFIT